MLDALFALLKDKSQVRLSDVSGWADQDDLGRAVDRREYTI